MTRRSLMFCRGVSYIAVVVFSAAVSAVYANGSRRELFLVILGLIASSISVILTYKYEELIEALKKISDAVDELAVKHGIDPQNINKQTNNQNDTKQD